MITKGGRGEDEEYVGLKIVVFIAINNKLTHSQQKKTIYFQ